MDLLPTIAAMTGASPPEDREIDGHDITPLLTGTGDEPSPTDAFLYYTAQGDLAGIRRGKWKLLLEPGTLYDLEVDISEKWDLAEQHPRLVEQLRIEALARDTLLTSQARPIRTVEHPLWDPGHLEIPRVQTTPEDAE